MNVSSWRNEKLSDRLNKILDKNKKTVYISFGSVIRSIDMPEEYK
ncbi:hypothetical protein CAEBREN_30670 [Caenorhabditis brenneri]|uniref:Uncharacterized protein n=1 Tax=Caenorhabditis brenneri TaxID=135651 RepID=G0MS89_CAEBE|nr:hypothetical protein CAEBREN_30670 [Caenorhabditis brenneri]